MHSIIIQFFLSCIFPSRSLHPSLVVTKVVVFFYLCRVLHLFPPSSRLKNLQCRCLNYIHGHSHCLGHHLQSLSAFSHRINNRITPFLLWTVFTQAWLEAWLQPCLGRELPSTFTVVSSHWTMHAKRSLCNRHHELLHGTFACKFWGS